MMAGIEHSLAVYLSNKQIAELSLIDDKLYWHYGQEWQQTGYPLSPHLSLNNTIPSENVQRFLRNLMPEGNGFDELLRSFHLSKYNTFGLIKALGQDIPGALIILPPQEMIHDEPLFRPITDAELEERLEKREVYSLIIWDAKPRLSSAGVQDKINVLINEQGQLGFGEGSLCSTHILKFEKQQLSHLVLNEFLTMQLAKECGLIVADVKLRRYGNYSTLLVDRFDRKFISMESIKRHHIIDGCQALNLPPEYKYERIFGSGRGVAHIRDGASYEKIFQFANRCVNPSVTKLRILDWALFNALVFNCDVHGKNISFFVDNDGIRLAPYYDLVNIKMYPEFEQEMAMAFGDEFNGDEITAYHLADFAECCQINRMLVARRLKTLANKLSLVLKNEYKLQTKTKDEMDYFKQYKSLILTRCHYLLDQADLIKSIKL
jgi:serine/threonine-protein kinase HipA